MTETGKPVPEVAEDLGINETALASWVSRAKRAEKATPEDQDALTARLTAENAALKKENKELGMERDVLKRCMVLWVKQLRRTRPPWPGRSAATGPSTTSRTPSRAAPWA
ncbi:transposase [Streptomyces sp. NPDC005820]|uniref:transposase n=1 Tax=Streptomyces sp. NPDC005820 TaxID=3157069 RepID=UPI0033C1CB57